MKITKKQIKEFHQSGDVSKLKEWFSSVFEEELEVGVWYKNIKEPLNIIYLESGNKDSFECYGFSDSGQWMELMNRNTFNCGPYTKATAQEVETALINEAKKRGFKNGVIVERPDSFINDGTVTILGGNFSLLGNIGLQLGGFAIMENGAWATIIKPKQMTQEQIEKELGYKIEIV